MIQCETHQKPLSECGCFLKQPRTLVSEPWVEPERAPMMTTGCWLILLLATAVVAYYLGGMGQ